MIFPWCYAFVPLEVRLEHLPLMPVATFLEVTGLAYTAVFLIIFVHEGGHWFFGRLVGIRIGKFVVGAGDSPVRFTWRGVAFSFGPWLRWGYVTEVPARANLVFGKQLVFLMGGVVAEAIFVAALWLVPVPGDLEGSAMHAFVLLRRFVLISGVITLWASAWPRLVTVEGHLTPNDALLIRRAWKNRGRADQIWDELETVNELNTLSQSGKYAEAASMFERMLQSGPRDPRQWQTLAALHAAAGNPESALRAHDAAIQSTEPNSMARAHAIDLAATFALELGRPEELARLRPLVEEAVKIAALPTLFGTLGALLIELGETTAGVELLNRCLAETDADHDLGIANAYLAKAALRLGNAKRADELLGFAKRKAGDHPLVQRVAQELEPKLQGAGNVLAKRDA